MGKRSMHEFKNWLNNQDESMNFFQLGLRSDTSDKKYEKYIGQEVFADVSAEKLLQKVETEEDANDIIDEFIENGGKVIDVEGKNVVVETKLGTFTVPRFCVTRD